MSGNAYYLIEYTDEVLPCDTTLEGWANWLSMPDTSWPHKIPNDGDEFDCSIIRFEDNIVATRRGGAEWTFSHEPRGEPSIMAIRYAEHLGWSAENLIYPCTIDNLREFLAENADDMDDEEFIAIGYDEPNIRLIYKADPPRLVVRP